MSKQSLLVIDGNSLVHRAFHAISLLSTSQGEITNAVYGFANMLFKVLDEIKPEMVAVCFDKGKYNFRHQVYEEYKGTRKATPEELRPQFPLVKELLAAMDIPVFEMEGYEADDLIGTLVNMAEKEKIYSVILTGDQDLLQLVSSFTNVLLTKKGITVLEEYDEKKVKDRYGLAPDQLVDLKGLTGDTSDNIPGVPGIGEKTGVKLISQFDTLENLLENTEQIDSKKTAEKIREFSDQARLSKRLATIERQVPMEVDFSCCRWKGPDYDKLLPVLSRLEFKSLIKNITAKNQKETVVPGDKPITTYKVGFQVVESTRDCPPENIKGRRIGLALEGDRVEGVRAAAISISEGQNFYIPVNSEENAGFILSLAGDSSIEKICFDAKSEMWKLAKHNAKPAGFAFDAMIAAYLLNPGSPNKDLNDLALEYLGVVLPTGGPASLCARADALRRLAPLLEEKIKQDGMEKLYYEVENPLVEILASMEMAGVKVDADKLSEMSAELGKRLDKLASDIYELSGETFNINSPRQLGQILFEKLQLPVIKKTKTGYSTDAEVLEELAGSHEIIDRLIDYRQLVKLKSTYVDGLIPLIDPATGLIHTTFQQAVTATGRLSSTEPNLQNIPIRLEEGRKIRKVFKPRFEENLILTADYSQIELRILAHMSGDPVLLEAFREKQDIHSRTASEVFGVALEDVTREMRDRAKAVNFGIIYGISDYGLSRDIKVTRKEAGKYIDSYFSKYRRAKEFIDRTISEAKDKGYVTTLLGRRRYLPDLFSSNRVIRNFGERTAINTPIQGSAADIIKLAMVKIWNELNKRCMQAKMVLQVHDELIFDVPISELEEIKQLVKENMENAVKLDVPLVVELKAGSNWYEVKKA